MHLDPETCEGICTRVAQFYSEKLLTINGTANNIGAGVDVENQRKSFVLDPDDIP